MLSVPRPSRPCVHKVNISNVLWLVFINFHSIKHKEKLEMCSISNIITFAVAAVVGGGLMFAMKTFQENDTPVNG